MQKWEYLRVSIRMLNSDRPLLEVNGKEIPFKGKLPEYLDYINKMGKEGWEMVSSENLSYTFKRPIE